MATCARLSARTQKQKATTGESSPRFVSAARGYCAAAGLDAGVAAFDGTLDNSGVSVSGVPDESGTLSDDAFSSVGMTSDGGVSCCWIGFCGSGGTVGR